MMTDGRRSPDVVMRLERMGSFHQCRLSFMRTLLRRMKREAWTFDRPRFDIDEHGVGTALYRARTPERSYCLVAFAHDLPDEQRSDRVIATAWDTTFALFDGDPTDADIERLRANVPLQEAGRVSGRELTLSRANRSVRLWETVVAALADGRPPWSASGNRPPRRRCGPAVVRRPGLPHGSPRDGRTGSPWTGSVRDRGPGP
ncbi:MAG: hypothetical protein AAGA65_30860, partial [Actinomycetota bacterium]